MSLTIDLNLAINLAAMVLAVVAILLTLIGFFASLRFYRDGVELQTRVRELLSRVDEKVASVQSQVGGMFEKTLDAVIGRSSPQSAAEDQRRLMAAAGKGGEAEHGVAPAGPPPAVENLPQKVMDYFAFRKLRYTDVASGDARAIFMLGAGHGFNLFDGPSGIVFFGYFHLFEPREIVARIRFLLNNIEAAYKRIESASADLREAAKGFLDQISIEVLIPEDATKEQLLTAIAAYQPNVREVKVTLHKPSELRTAVEAEYSKMGL